ncbi:MAG: hypothetical protein ACLT4A_10530 [Anaerobutyricum soehngenii]
MLTYQLSSKNLSIGEKIAITEEFQKEVKIENEKKKLSTLKQNSSNRSIQLEGTDKKKNNTNKDTWTDSQLRQRETKTRSSFR